MSRLSLQSIASTFDALQTEADALKQLSGTALLAGIAELKDKIVTARMNQMSALERIIELEQKVMQSEDWERECQRYQPIQFEPGVTVYIERASQQSTGHVQHYCPNCYAERRIRILQPTGGTSNRRAQRKCLNCKSELAYGVQAPLPRVQTARSD